jgi:hypothetical protein
MLNADEEEKERMKLLRCTKMTMQKWKTRERDEKQENSRNQT